MMRCLLAVAALVCCTVAFAQEATVEVPQEIDELLCDFHDTILIGDTETAATYLTKLALVQAQIGGAGKDPDLLRLGEANILDSLDREYVTCLVAGDQVMVEYDLEIKGVDAKTDEEKDETWRMGMSLTRLQDQWRINGYHRFDPERRAQIIKDGVLHDEQMGIQMPAPKEWIPRLIRGRASFLVALTMPDLSTGLALAAQDLPIAITAKAAAQGEQKLLGLLTQLGVQAEAVSEKETTLAGMPAYETVSAITADGMTVHTRRVYTVYTSETEQMLYVLVATTQDEDGFERYKAELAKVEAGLKITGPTARELPPELGKIADGKYLNSACEFGMDIAEGWKARLAESRFLYQLTLSAPDSESTMMAGAVKLEQWVEPKLAAYGDLQVYKQQDPNLEIVSEGPIDKEGAQGYQILSDLTLQEGQLRRRWQVFFMRGTRLHFFVGEAVPADDYDNVKDAWQAMMDSVIFGPVAQD